MSEVFVKGRTKREKSPPRGMSARSSGTATKKTSFLCTEAMVAMDRLMNLVFAYGDDTQILRRLMGVTIYQGVVEGDIETGYLSLPGCDNFKT